MKLLLSFQTSVSPGGLVAPEAGSAGPGAHETLLLWVRLQLFPAYYYSSVLRIVLQIITKSHIEVKGKVKNSNYNLSISTKANYKTC